MSDRKRIGDYALLGDTRTAALVDTRGSIDWMCLPRFDGDPVFGRLVAGDGGGHFSISPPPEAELTERGYRPGTPLLESEWRIGRSRLRMAEGMVSDLGRSLLPGTCLVRRVEAHGGAVRVRVCFDPRRDAARYPLLARRTSTGVVCSAGATAVWLGAEPHVELAPGRAVEVEVRPDRPLTLALTASHRSPLTILRPLDAWRALLADAASWRRWSDRFEYRGPLPAVVERSLITLRLLTYSPSGAPVAAPTTSLPEWPGGARNWDYRYAWPRDASIGIGAFLGVGVPDQAQAFLSWLLHASRLDRPRLPALLTIHGTPVPQERELDGWRGFEGSRPVRFGNGARNQHQLDSYGWVLDAMWVLVSRGHRLDGETWRAGRALADEVVRRWRAPDSGIWEVRGEPLHHVHSKLMAWTALDRAVRIARTHRTRASRVLAWRAERDAIAAQLAERGFDGRRGSYVRAYGRTDLDAAVLLVPILGFEPAGSPRARGTVEAIRDELSAGGPFLYRYPPGEDGLEGGEGAFLPCSFWLVHALAAIGELEQAITLFQELTSLGGPVGLLSEEVDPSSGELLGNHPQALTHATLVQAALAIAHAQEGPSRSPSEIP